MINRSVESASYDVYFSADVNKKTLSVYRIKDSLKKNIRTLKHDSTSIQHERHIEAVEVRIVPKNKKI